MLPKQHVTGFGQLADPRLMRENPSNLEAAKMVARGRPVWARKRSWPPSSESSET